MYIDGWTITALVIFIIMLAVFVRFCRVKVCGPAALDRQIGSAQQELAAGDES